MSRGFTLIELLVALAILGVLAGIIIGSYNTAQHTKYLQAQMARY